MRFRLFLTHLSASVIPGSLSSLLMCPLIFTSPAPSLSLLSSLSGCLLVTSSLYSLLSLHLLFDLSSSSISPPCLFLIFSLSLVLCQPVSLCLFSRISFFDIIFYLCVFPLFSPPPPSLPRQPSRSYFSGFTFWLLLSPGDELLNGLTTGCTAAVWVWCLCLFSVSI